MPRYARIAVKLLDVKPPIRREFLIREAATFQDLHEAIQDAGGWEDCHLYAFHEKKDGSDIVAGIPEDVDDDVTPDARETKLSRFFKRADPRRCFYQYDFGDNWWLEVSLREVVDLSEKFTRRLVSGARAFPPEDCGGIPGYEACCAIFRGEALDDSEARPELREWMGDWDPERFDLGEVQKAFNA